MTEIRTEATTTPPTTSNGTFIRHFLEMVVAMTVGMVALAPLWELVFAGLGVEELFDRPDLSTLVMATNMTIGMTLWMRYRGHGWAAIGEMAAAMYVPFVILFIPFWAGAISGDVLVIAGHVLMLLCMVGVMLRRRTEYSTKHRRTRTR